MSVKHLGTIAKIYSSGMVETDKGAKFPYSRANVGDVMVEIEGSRKVITKEAYRELTQKPKAPKQKTEETKEDEDA